jgi:predicted aldo/keto reductase-like oxidoreductase
MSLSGTACAIPTASIEQMFHSVKQVLYATRNRVLHLRMVTADACSTPLARKLRFPREKARFFDLRDARRHSTAADSLEDARLWSIIGYNRGRPRREEAAVETRILGRTGLEVGVIGLGTEHLINTRQNMDAVLDLAVPAGVSYIDLVFNDPVDDHATYWDAIGPALRRHRERLVLCLHWGFVYHEPVDRCQRCFDQALDQLGNGFAEVAMLTMVDSESLWQNWARQGIERLDRYRRDGRIGFIGMSNHNPAVARTAVQSGLIDVLMFPVNLYEHPEDPARAALLETCAEHQVGVVAMKPYRGGRLLTTEGRPTGITPAQCLHYVLSQPVSTAVPGARDADQVRRTLGYLEASTAERQFAPLHDELTERLRGQCVGCLHCLPCPQEIDIPGVITNLEYVEFYSGSHWSEEFNREVYARRPAKASDCIECEECLERCPFGVDIIGKMRRAAEVMEGLS